MRLHAATFEMDRRTLFLIPPGTPFGSRLRSPVDHFFVHFTIPSHLLSIPQGIYPVVPGREARSRITMMIARIEDRQADPYGELLLVAIISGALVTLPHKYLSPRCIDSRIREAMDHIKANYAQRLSNEELARRAALSTNGFIRLFSREAGVSPHAFALSQRLDQACIMLHHSERSIDEIAERCGFNDRSYFTKMLRKYRGISPARFRKERFA